MDVFTDGMTEQQLHLQQVMECQLAHLETMIRDSRNSHRHYTDDCGDYLTAALDLSSKMMEMRIDGIEEFEKQMLEWRQEARNYSPPDADDDEYTGAEGYLLENYASDGIASEVYKWMIEE